jgi:hypothetical protein
MMDPKTIASSTLLDRIEAAMKEAELRMAKAVAALTAAGLPHMVVGGQAVGIWIASAEGSIARPTFDVDILVRRHDLDAIKTALERAGFVYRHAASLDMFLDPPELKPREAVHLLFAGERVKPDAVAANPDPSQSDMVGPYRVATLEALVQMKLTAFRDKDRVHLRDLIDVGLIDRSWPAKFPGALEQRLQSLLDTPDG